MGTIYHFECANCGYNVDVSGGKDYGMHSSTETMTCLDCDKLIDVLTQSDLPNTDEYIGLCGRCRGSNLAAWRAKPEQVVNGRVRLPVVYPNPAVRIFRRTRFQIRRLFARTKSLIVEVAASEENFDGPCPKCNYSMTRYLETILWD